MAVRGLGNGNSLENAEEGGAYISVQTLSHGGNPYDAGNENGHGKEGLNYLASGGRKEIVGREDGNYNVHEFADVSAHEDSYRQGYDLADRQSAEYAQVCEFAEPISVAVVGGEHALEEGAYSLLPGAGEYDEVGYMDLPVS